MTTEIKPENLSTWSRPGCGHEASSSTTVRAGGTTSGPFANGGFIGPKPPRAYSITDEFIRGVEIVLEHEYGRVNGRFDGAAQELLEEIIAGEILRQREGASK